MIIKGQLGRTPRGFFSVATRCHRGSPQVLITAPVFLTPGLEKAIFPTTFYLTCPYLVKGIHLLESNGFIKKIQKHLKRDPSLQNRLLSSHNQYQKYRANLLSSEEYLEIKEKLEEVGIGGIKGEGIKCLHAHYAHYQVFGKNPVGEIVERLLTANSGKGCKFCKGESGG